MNPQGSQVPYDPYASRLIGPHFGTPAFPSVNRTQHGQVRGTPGFRPGMTSEDLWGTRRTCDCGQEVQREPKFAVDLKNNSVYTSIVKACTLKRDNKVKLTIGSGEQQTVRWVEKAVLATVPHFEKCFRFPDAIQQDQQEPFHVNLEAFHPDAISDLFLPWCFFGLGSNAETVASHKICLPVWAHFLLFLDYIEDHVMVCQVLKHLINRMSSYLFNDRTDSTPEMFSRIAQIYTLFEDLPYRFAVVHVVFQAQAHSKLDLTSLLSMLNDTNFGADYTRWHRVLPQSGAHMGITNCPHGLPRREPAYNSHGSYKLYSSDQILLPILFDIQGMEETKWPVWFEPNVTDTGNGIRKSVRDCLKVNFN